MNTTQPAKLFLIHGLFVSGSIMAYLRVQLEKCGYDVKVFSYKSVGNSLHENAGLLVDFVQQHRQAGETCHFVGHSLGGLLIRLAYEIAPALFTGKIVTIGSPHNGSLVAKRVAEDIHRAVLGGAYDNALDGEMPAWRGEVPLGSIAGTKSIGVGMAMRDLPRPNDGTVSVSETQLANQSDHLIIDLSHTALIYSSRVVSQVDAFLQNGTFLHDADVAPS
ncbi:MAG: acetyltransferase [Gammaproteobacteria bacterium]|nr:MAG: acetyltransferase [Gammaproteobacteria bacterium]